MDNEKDIFEKNRSILIRHLGNLEVKMDKLIFRNEVDYDSIIYEAQEIVKVVSFLKTNMKIKEEMERSDKDETKQTTWNDVSTFKVGRYD